MNSTFIVTYASLEGRLSGCSRRGLPVQGRPAHFLRILLMVMAARFTLLLASGVPCRRRHTTPPPLNHFCLPPHVVQLILHPLLTSHPVDCY